MFVIGVADACRAMQNSGIASRLKSVWGFAFISVPEGGLYALLVEKLSMLMGQFSAKSAFLSLV